MPSCCSSCDQRILGYGAPQMKALVEQNSMDFSCRFMTVHLEMIAELIHRTEKSLSLRNGFEFLHFSLSDSSHLVRVFCSIVCPFIGNVWRQREMLFAWKSVTR